MEYKSRLILTKSLMVKVGDVFRPTLYDAKNNTYDLTTFAKYARKN